MESVKVEQLLERYFEGDTSLAEEQALRTYFQGINVAPHLEAYVGMFTAFAKAQQDTFEPEISLPKKRRNYRWFTGVAAAVIIGVGFVLQMPSSGGNDLGSYSEEEAILKTKQTLGLVSKMLNQSTAQLGVVKQFEKIPSSFLSK